MAIRYFALVHNTRNVDDPFGVFREITEPHYRTEVYDRKARKWVENTHFMTYTLHGETGAEPITKAKAEEITEKLTPS